MRHYTILALCLAISACASRDGSDGIAFSAGPPFPTRSGAALIRHPQRRYWAPPELSESDLDQIERRVAGLTDDRILQMELIDPETVEVTTGDIRGPHDGGGFVYRFQRQGSDWVQVNKDSPSFWVS